VGGGCVDRNFYERAGVPSNGKRLCGSESFAIKVESAIIACSSFLAIFITLSAFF
jgi:hypothetical protein